MVIFKKLLYGQYDILLLLPLQLHTQPVKVSLY